MSEVNCTICQKPIPPGRLEAVPYTQLCIQHAREVEKFGGEFTLTGVCGNIGKAGSLKKNYGDVEVIKERNEAGIQRLREVYNS